MPFQKPCRTAGLAYGDGQMTLACMAHYPHQMKLEKLETVSLPESLDDLTETARKLVTLTGCRGWPSAVALSDHQTIRREIRLSSAQPLSERDLDLREHLNDYLPDCPPLICMDHIVLKAGKTEDHVLLVAAPENVVCQAVATAENAGLLVRIVDIDSVAKKRAQPLTPLHQIPCAKTINKALLRNITPTLLTALGLSMRRCPVW